jgi:hypothetical protein
VKPIGLRISPRIPRCIIHRGSPSARSPYFRSLDRGSDLLSSRLRAIDSTRLETLGKSTVHSTRDAASRRARSDSVNVSPERRKVLEVTQHATAETHDVKLLGQLSYLPRRPSASERMLVISAIVYQTLVAGTSCTS